VALRALSDLLAYPGIHVLPSPPGSLLDGWNWWSAVRSQVAPFLIYNSWRL
jgi:hypothetical protein